MSVLASVVSRVSDLKPGSPRFWEVTMAGGWTIAAPAPMRGVDSVLIGPNVGDSVVYVTELANGTGRVVGLVIDGVVYIDGPPYVDAKCAPGNTPAEIVAAEARGAERMRARCLELTAALSDEYVKDRDAAKRKAERSPAMADVFTSEANTADDSAIAMAAFALRIQDAKLESAFALRIQDAKLESVLPGTHVPDRVSDGAILDAVRAAVQALLEDRELSVAAPPHDERRTRWRELLAAVSMPAERVPPGTHLDPGAPSTPR